MCNCRRRNAPLTPKTQSERHGWMLQSEGPAELRMEAPKWQIVMTQSFLHTPSAPWQASASAKGQESAG